MRETTGGRIYQAKITLKGIRPPIWRRIQVPGIIRLADLHQVIQTAFGWTDSHLHQFVIAGRRFGAPGDFDQEILDEAGVTLAGAVGNRIKRFAYIYDFGDNWEHDVGVEKIISGNSGGERPLCLGGRRRRPPEDCGGPPGYAGLLRAICDARHPEHEAVLEWVGGAFDLEAFDIAAVNRALAGLRIARAWVQ
jgi:pRiA4b ORF-3-like protein